MSHLPQRPSHGSFDRRQFLKTAGGVVVAGAVLPTLGAGLYAAPTKESAPETAVGNLYNSLNDKQKKTICFEFDNKLRSDINANWHITKPTIGDDFYTAEQRTLITEIVKGTTSEDGYERFVKQMEFDDGGLDFYSCAIFGDPATDKFEWELTGRHLTLRADGNSVPGAAFGGPLVYGHGESDPNENLFGYQTKQTHEVFKSLSADQTKSALLKKAPKENAVQLQGEGADFPGLHVADMSEDQQKLVEETLAVLLAPYRQDDVDEALAILKENGGVKSLHMAFYEQGDLNSDKMWDIWRVEGPGFAWHFRGAPHVHAYINIGAAKKT